MKKLFVCAMALAAFVSCSKDDVQGPALDSGNKSVSIQIANSASATRSTTGGASGLTAAGVGDEESKMSCETEADDLTILFADKDGKVLMRKSLTDDEGAIAENGNHTNQYLPETNNGEGGLYTWHNVPWDVTQVAVVRVTAEDGELATIAAYEALALNEDANRERSLDEIVLFGTKELTDTGNTHVVGDIYYHYWKADVTVEPLLARFEINNIECSNLGAYNLPSYVQKPGEYKYSFDKLTIGAAAWTSEAGKTYSLAGVNGKVLYGAYNTPEGGKNNVQAGEDVVWSWNVNTTDTQFDTMTVPLVADAYDYDPAETDVPLSVTDIQDKDGKSVEFVPGNIYQLDLTFTEENIMDQDQLCVEVTVTIAKWTINTVKPVFGKN